MTAAEFEFFIGCGPHGSHHKKQDQIGENQEWPMGETYQSVECGRQLGRYA